MGVFSMITNYDRMLWDRIQSDKFSLLKWAQENKDNDREGIKANVMHILYNFHMGGWCGVPRDHQIATLYLEEAAKLGHSQATYDFARDAMRDRPQDAERYIDTALTKIDDSSFDSINHKQSSMKNELEGLKKVIEVIRNMPRARLTIS